MFGIDFNQGTTKRGVVRALVAIAACWSWYHNDVNQAIGAFTVGEGLKAWLGVTDEQ
jgi:hypothetical protein